MAHASRAPEALRHNRVKLVGWTGIRFNPRLQVATPTDYAALMNGLNLANPKMMDVAVPANLRVGRGQADDAHPE